MANLKGSTYQKQLKDLNHRLFALGTKKGNDNLTHSNALKDKRNQIMKSYIKFLEHNNIHGKLNQNLNESILNRYINEHISHYSVSTKENHLSTLNSLLNGLKEVNITHGVSNTFLKDKLSTIKANSQAISKQSRGIQDNTIDKLYNIRYSSAIMSELMFNHGYRVSEALNIVNNPNNYISKLSNGDIRISNVIGKGGKIYHDKYISNKLYQSIRNIDNKLTKSTFHNDLKKIDTNLRAHDFRYTFARNLFNTSLKEFGYKKALNIVSKALNHNRSSITLYYLNK